MKNCGMLLVELLLSIALLSLIGLMSQSLIYRMFSVDRLSEVEVRYLLDSFSEDSRSGTLDDVNMDGGTYPVYRFRESGAYHYSFEKGEETPFFIYVKRFSGAAANQKHSCFSLEIRGIGARGSFYTLGSRWLFI